LELSLPVFSKKKNWDVLAFILLFRLGESIVENAALSLLMKKVLVEWANDPRRRYYLWNFWLISLTIGGIIGVVTLRRSW
jgi:hypothetical protein